MPHTSNAPPAVISLVIPAYNEAAAIVSVVDEATDVLGRLGIPSEVVVVDDASRDGTADVVTRRGGVTLLRNPINLGYGHSLLRGIEVARGELIAICDGDGSYDLSILPELVSRLKEGVDHAIAERTGPAFQRPFVRRTIYRWLCGYVVGTRVPDANSGLRVFRRTVLESVRADLCLGFSFTTSLTLASLMSGYLTEFRRARYRRRVGQSHVRFRDALRTAQYLFQLIAAYNPLKVFVPLVGASLLSGAVALALGLSRGEPWLALAVASWLVSLLLTGLAALSYVVVRASGGPTGLSVRTPPGVRPPAGVGVLADVSSDMPRRGGTAKSARGSSGRPVGRRF